jgi:hypothetical protein
LPLVCILLGQAYVGEYAVDELAGHVGGVLRVVVQGWDDREDGGSCIRGELHIAQVDAVEGGLAHAEDEGAILFEADVGSALDEIGGESTGDARQGTHGTGQDDHGCGGVAAAGNVGGDVGLGVLLELEAGGAEELFGEIVAAAQVKLFGEDAEGALRGDEIDLCDAGVGGEDAQYLDGINAAAGSGYGEGNIARRLKVLRHRDDYRRWGNLA